MNILITNDDGITSDGIIRLARIASAFGRVYVIAPDGQRSAASHSITLRSPIELHPVDFLADVVSAYACTGTPADCVRIGLSGLLPEGDILVLSGINRGYNIGSDTQYSATVGAAMEGAWQRVLSIAVSEDTGEDHSAAERFLPGILGGLISRPLPFNSIYNINIPTVPADDIRGILSGTATSESSFYKDLYPYEKLDDGGMRFKVNGVFCPDGAPGTDLRAVLDNYISIGVLTNLH